MTDDERRERLRIGIARSAENVRDVLSRWHELDDDLREHYMDELEWMLERAAALIPPGTPRDEWGRPSADAAVIAAAREDVPGLLAEVERLREIEAAAHAYRDAARAEMRWTPTGAGSLTTDYFDRAAKAEAALFALLDGHGS